MSYTLIMDIISSRYLIAFHSIRRPHMRNARVHQINGKPTKSNKTIRSVDALSKTSNNIIGIINAPQVDELFHAISM